MPWKCGTAFSLSVMPCSFYDKRDGSFQKEPSPDWRQSPGLSASDFVPCIDKRQKARKYGLFGAFSGIIMYVKTTSEGFTYDYPESGADPELPGSLSS